MSATSAKKGSLIRKKLIKTKRATGDEENNEAIASQ